MPVYFIEAVGTGLVKIGFTNRWVSQRLRELQTTSPHHLRLLHSLDGTAGGDEIMEFLGIANKMEAV